MVCFFFLLITSHLLSFTTYSLYPDLIFEIPRAYSKITFRNGSTQIIHGLPKFTSPNSIDEDENDDENILENELSNTKEINIYELKVDNINKNNDNYVSSDYNICTKSDFTSLFI